MEKKGKRKYNQQLIRYRKYRQFRGIFIGRLFISFVVNSIKVFYLFIFILWLDIVVVFVLTSKIFCFFFWLVFFFMLIICKCKMYGNMYLHLLYFPIEDRKRLSKSNRLSTQLDARLRKFNWNWHKLWTKRKWSKFLFFSIKVRWNVVDVCLVWWNLNGWFVSAVTTMSRSNWWIYNNFPALFRCSYHTFETCTYL